jgi:hypothetical protein
MTLSLASIYQSCTKTSSDNVYMCFLDMLDGLLNKFPKSELIIGADINANIGRFNNMSVADLDRPLGHTASQKETPKERVSMLYILHTASK